MSQTIQNPTKSGAEPGATRRPLLRSLAMAALGAIALTGCVAGEPEGGDETSAPALVGEASQDLQPGCVTITRGSGTTQDATITTDPTDPSKAITNNGSAITLSTGATGAATREALLSFGLAGKVPNGSVVTSATLTLNKASNVGAGTVLVHRATSSWQESSVTWSSFNQSFDPTIEATLDSTVTGNQTVDITPVVKQWQAGLLPNDGLLLEQVAGTGRTSFGSAEGTSPSLRPKLTVCYAGPSCSDGLQNQGEGGVDCGGPCANACATCSDGIQNQGETGVDCGGPCGGSCGSCSDFIQNQGETGIDCGGPCSTPCITIQVEGHADVQVGCDPTDYYCQGHLVCNAVTYPITGQDCLWQQYDCWTGSQGSWYPQDGISGGSNFNFAYAYDFGGGSYGNICACDLNQLTVYGLAGNHQYCGSGHWLRGPAPTCVDGLKNGTETGVDCGGSCGACPNLCGNGIQDSDEGGVDCGGTWCGACPFLSFVDTNSDDLGNTALLDYFTSLGTVTSSQYMFFEVQADNGWGGAWCSDNADFYVNAYIANFGSGNGVPDGNWGKIWRDNNGGWNGPDTNSYQNYYGNWCLGTYGWCSEWGLGNHYLGIAPGGAGADEAYANGWGSGNWQLKIAVGNDISVCGVTCNVNGVQDYGELGVDCGGVCGACTDMCNDGIQNSDEIGTDCGGTFCGACPSGFQVLAAVPVQSNGHAYTVLKVSRNSDMSTGPTWCDDYSSLCGQFGLAPTGCGDPYVTQSNGYGTCATQYGSVGHDDSQSCNPSGSIANLAQMAGFADAQWDNSFGFHYCDSGSCTKQLCSGSGCNSALSYIDSSKAWGYTVCTAAPSCNDGVKNQGETGLDCGGPCGACADMCNDGLQNSDENGVDCGGSFCAACPFLSFVDTTSDDVSTSALFDYFTSLGAVSSSQYIFFEVQTGNGNGGAWCSDNADFYVSNYLSNYGQGNGVPDGNWGKLWRDENGAWSSADTNTYWNYYGNWCLGTYGWCSEWGLGNHYLGINPAGSGIDEAFANGWGSGNWQLKIAVGNDISVCGIAPPSCSDSIKNQGEVGVDCGGPCGACTDMCNDGVQSSDETGVDCGGTFCAPCPMPAHCVHVGPEVWCGDWNNQTSAPYTLCGYASPAAAGPYYDAHAAVMTAAQGLLNCQGATTDSTFQQITNNHNHIQCYSPTNVVWFSGDRHATGQDLDGWTSGGPRPYVRCTNYEAAPTCTDGYQNQGESGVDCGGPCSACTPMCSDGIQDSDESGVDCGGSFCAACPLGFQVLAAVPVQNAGHNYTVLKVSLNSLSSTGPTWCDDYSSLCGQFGLSPTGCGDPYVSQANGYGTCASQYGSVGVSDVQSCNPSGSIANLAQMAGFADAQWDNSFGFHYCDASSCTKQLCSGSGCNSALSYMDASKAWGYTVCTN